MGGRLTRRQLKRNELAETVGRTVDYVSRHKRGVSEGVAVAGGLALLVGGFLLIRVYRQRQAGNELSEALAVLQTPLVSDAAQGAPKTFASAAERDQLAKKHLTAAASRRSTTAGRAAQLILAARGEKLSEGSEIFAKAAGGGKGEVAAISELDAARSLAAQGKTAEAIERLKRAIESAGSAVPKDVLLFALAEVYERAGSSADARATYQRLVNDYPNSPYRADARQKVPAS